MGVVSCSKCYRINACLPVSSDSGPDKHYQEIAGEKDSGETFNQRTHIVLFVVMETKLVCLLCNWIAFTFYCSGRKAP